MDEWFGVGGLALIGALVLLEILIGYDALLRTKIEARRAPEADRGEIARLGFAAAILGRLVLLFVLLALVRGEREPFLTLAPFPGLIEARLSAASLVHLAGGVLALSLATRGVALLYAIRDLERDVTRRGQKTRLEALAFTVGLNLLLAGAAVSAGLALTTSFLPLALAIVVAGLWMIGAVDRVGAILERRRTLVAFGYFALGLIGLRALTLGAHEAQMRVLGEAVTPLGLPALALALGVLGLVHLGQRGFRKQLLAERKAEMERGS